MRSLLGYIDTTVADPAISLNYASLLCKSFGFKFGRIGMNSLHGYVDTTITDLALGLDYAPLLCNSFGFKFGRRNVARASA